MELDYYMDLLYLLDGPETSYSVLSRILYDFTLHACTQDQLKKKKKKKILFCELMGPTTILFGFNQIPKYYK